MDRDFFSRLTKPAVFALIRHGESEGNAAGILQGRGEYPLSAAGRTQVREKARALAELAGAVPAAERLFFSSPQSRARETAEILREHCSLPAPVFLNDLREMHLGEWTGKTWAGVNGGGDPGGTDSGGFGASGGDSGNGGGDGAWDTFRTKSWDAVPGAERSGELFDRALRVWGRLRDDAAASGASLVLAVSHGGLIQWLVKSTV
ncbi:MAG: histidine phosphatase family protein, partial [Treponema sp.]|nr:histidine phosphatase family protein [Treponema sp.]